MIRRFVSEEKPILEHIMLGLTRSLTQIDSLYPGRRFFQKQTLLSPTAILLYIALADFCVHMLIAGNYGYFRDELYYIVAGERLSFGYVDFPPVIALLAALLNLISKDSLVSIHVVPAIAGSMIVFLSGKITKEFGGGRRAQILAAVATTFSASFAVASIFSMDVLDMLWWSLLAYILVRIIKTDNKSSRLWVIFGIVAGVGLLTKLTLAFFLVSILIAFAVTKKRTYLKSKWPWFAALIAFLILLPYIAWNALNNWATVDFFIHHGGLNGGGFLSFLTNQILIAGLLGLPLAAVGLAFFFKSRIGHPYSILGLSFVILLILFTFMNAKPYFIMGAYPFIFAGGAVLVENFSRGRKRIVLPSYLGAILVVGILLAPLYAPVLAPQTFVSYYGGLTGAANGAAAQQNAGAFPQYLGDRFGWNTMTKDVSIVYHNLTASEQSEACILTENYGEASALTFFGGQYNLPPVISGHNNYFIWGPGRCSGNVLIIIGYYPSDIQGYFQSITIRGNITCSYCVPGENGLPIIVATGMNVPIQSAWALLKHYD